MREGKVCRERGVKMEGEEHVEKIHSLRRTADEQCCCRRGPHAAKWAHTAPK